MNDLVSSSWKIQSNLTGKNNSSPFSAAEILTVQLSHSILGAIGFIENVGIVLVIFRNRITLLDVPSNWFVLSLALSDAVTCLATIVAVLCLTTGRMFDFLCDIVQFALLVSVGNLLLLTFNRFLSVYTSLRYPALLTLKRAKGLQTAPWILAFIFSVSEALSHTTGVPFVLYATNLYYTASILMTSIFNVYILKQARDKRKVAIHNAYPIGNGNGSKTEFRLVIRLLIVNLIFFGSCIPVMIIFHIYSSQKSRQSASYVRKVVWCYFAVLLNAAANPLVYGSKLPVFQRWFEKRKQRRFLQAVSNGNSRLVELRLCRSDKHRSHDQFNVSCTSIQPPFKDG